MCTACWQGSRCCSRTCIQCRVLACNLITASYEPVGAEHRECRCIYVTLVMLHPGLIGNLKLYMYEAEQARNKRSARAAMIASAPAITVTPMAFRDHSLVVFNQHAHDSICHDTCRHVILRSLLSGKKSMNAVKWLKCDMECKPLATQFAGTARETGENHRLSNRQRTANRLVHLPDRKISYQPYQCGTCWNKNIPAHFTLIRLLACCSEKRQVAWCTCTWVWLGKLGLEVQYNKLESQVSLAGACILHVLLYLCQQLYSAAHVNTRQLFQNKHMFSQ